MAIFVTGDLHGSYDISKLGMRSWPAQRQLTKNDYLIIAGDFGIIWYNKPDHEEEYWLEWFDEKPFTTLFIDGNHENHNRLAQYPVTNWNGGNVHKINDSVYHLMRGQYYNIEGTTFWTMGGARSHDIQDGILDPTDPRDALIYDLWSQDPSKMFRIKNVDWWEQEVPSEDECALGVANLGAHGNKVDFIITHEAPASDVFFMNHLLFHPDKYSHWLEDEIQSKIDYGYWLFGHYHMDKAITYKDVCIYDKIKQIV